MSQIDWSKAPEGTTHYGPAVELEWLACWYKKVDGEWLVWLVDGGTRWGSAGNTVERIKQLISRPQEWTGEGLPPAGLKVEGLIAGNGDWCELTLKYRSTDFSVFEGADGEEFPLWNPQYSAFRPVRTPEQIAAEAREKAINAMAEILTHDGSFFQDAERLYDAGYRKFEITEE